MGLIREALISNYDGMEKHVRTIANLEKDVQVEVLHELSGGIAGIFDAIRDLNRDWYEGIVEGMNEFMSADTE